MKVSNYLVLVLVLSISLAFGCNKGPEAPAPQAPAQGKTEAPAAAPAATPAAAPAAEAKVEAPAAAPAAEAKVEAPAAEAKVEAPAAAPAAEAKVEAPAAEAKVEAPVAAPAAEAKVEAPADGAEKVEVQFFIMSQCPFGVQVIDGILPALEEMGGYINFKVDFIGDIQGDKLGSMHGENEVAGDKIELCTMKYAPEKFGLLFSCVNKEYRKLPNNWEECAKTVSYDDALIGQIKACYEGEEGTSLLKASFEKAQQMGARGSPTIYIAGKPYQGGRTKVDFMQAVCNEMKNAPSICANLPKPKKIELIVVADRRCTERNCAVDSIVSSLKGLFPGLEAEVHDYSTDKGKELFTTYQLKFLPALIFGDDVKETPNFRRIERYLRPTAVAGKSILDVGASFDPTAEICDNKQDDTGNGKVDCEDDTCKNALVCREEKKNQLDVFVMSQCPYGVMALNAMQEIFKAFGNDITFSIHFIASEDGEGFKALHGQPEVDENIRELCAIKYYPEDRKYMDYIWCRNKDIRNAEWKPCAEQSGMDVAKMEACSTGDEGKQLLREDIKIGIALGVSGSPTWLANNKYKFQGADPRAIQSNVCKYNPELPGCKVEIQGADKPAPAGACGG